MVVVSAVLTAAMAAITWGITPRGRITSPGLTRKKIGLEEYAKREQIDVIRSKVKVDYDGSPQNGRSYDGLVKNDDGPNTYTGIEVKSGRATDDDNRPGSTQRQFDEAVDGGTPARGRLDGEEILVTRVETEIVP